jgi:hypothetical protein
LILIGWGKGRHPAARCWFSRLPNWFRITGGRGGEGEGGKRVFARGRNGALYMTT